MRYKRTLEWELVRELGFRMYNSAVGFGKGAPFPNVKKPTDLFPLDIDNTTQLSIEEKREEAQESAKRVDDYMKRKKIGKYATK